MLEGGFSEWNMFWNYKKMYRFICWNIFMFYYFKRNNSWDMFSTNDWEYVVHLRWLPHLITSRWIRSYTELIFLKCILTDKPTVVTYGYIIYYIHILIIIYVTVIKSRVVGNNRIGKTQLYVYFLIWFFCTNKFVYL